VYQCRRTRKSKWAARQHELYGRFVRIAPNHISITDPAAITQIYGGRGFLKGPFYEDRSPFLDYGRVTNMFLPFHQVEPVLFNTRDANIHNRKWRFMNGAFSRKNLQDFEVYMDPNIVLLVKALEKFALESKACDFVIWGKMPPRICKAKTDINSKLPRLRSHG
jgi:benzoate 4-monooxygenase